MSYYGVFCPSEEQLSKFLHHSRFIQAIIFAKPIHKLFIIHRFIHLAIKQD